MCPRKLDLVVQERAGPSGRSICGIPRRLFPKLGLTGGDYVAIEGRKRTGAVVFPVAKGARGKIQMDGVLRTNAGVDISEKVAVRSLVPVSAKSITLVPVEGQVHFTATRGSHHSLVHRVFTAGDFVVVAGNLEHVTPPKKPFDPLLLAEWKRIFPSFNFNPMKISHGETLFLVRATEPGGIVLAEEDTHFEFMDVQEKLAGVEVFPDVLGEEYQKITDEVEAVVHTLQSLPRNDLLAKIRGQTPLESPIYLQPFRTELVKDLKVVALVLQVAAGTCEACGKSGPFYTNTDCAYVEVHRLVPFSENPLDYPAIFAAVCPNCHRELHMGKNRQALAKRLLVKSHDIARNLNLT